MFTKQTGLLRSLLTGLTPDKIIQALQDTYHNCAAFLQHRAPIRNDVDGAKESVPQRDYTADIENVWPALSIYNHSSWTEGPLPPIKVNGGFAIDAKGVCRFQMGEVMAGGGANIFNNLNISVIIIDGCWIQNLYVLNIYNQDGTVWGGQQALVRFTLTGPLASGSAGATVTQYSGADGLDPGATVTVYDPDSLFTRALTGCKGRAEYNATSGHFEVIACQQAAFELSATAFEFCGASNQQTIDLHDDVAVVSPAPFDFLPPGITTCNNPLYLAGRADTKVRMFWNKQTSAYEAIQVSQLTQQIVTEINLSGSLTYSIMTINTMPCGQGESRTISTTTC